MKLAYKILVLVLTLSIVSCNDLLDINDDPDRVSEARAQELLTGAQGYLSWIVDDRYNQQSSLWSQYETWGPGVSLGDVAQFVVEPIDYNNVWIRAYSNALTDLSEVIKIGIPAYSGVAKILQAYIYQGLVDHFGAIPFSEALLGIENLAPSYDEGAVVYAGLVTLIDGAMSDLSGQTTNEAVMGANDLIYGGNLENWRKFGNSLKLRILMRQSVQGGPADLASQVTALISSGSFIEDNADNAKMEFDGISGDENPMYAGQESGIEYFYVASEAFFNVLDDLQDPRKATLFNPAVNTGLFTPVAQGDIQNPIYPFTATKEDFSQVTEVAYAADATVIYMSAWETWFLRAEAAARFGTADDETTSFNTAVQTNFAHTGTAMGGYLAGLGYNAGAGLEERMQKLAIQKWISMAGFQEDEGWIETRRFDTPTASIFKGGIFQNPPQSILAPGEFPNAWLYPETEQSFNSNAPLQRSITDKVFWDN